MELRSGSKSYRSTWKVYEALYFLKPRFMALFSAHGGENDHSNSDESPINPINKTHENITVDVDLYEDSNNHNQQESDSAVTLSDEEEPPSKKRIGSPNLASEDSNEGSALFFKSLLPFMSQMNNIQKLRVRNTIQDVIRHELEDLIN